MELSQTVRRLRRTPAFTLVTLATLAVGIGATTAIFSVVNGVLIEPLPFPESDRLIALTHRSVDNDHHAASPAIYFTYKDHNETFESVALWYSDAASITGAGDPEEVQALVATHEFLPTLGVRPALGRAFTPAEGEPGSAATVILSHGYWQRRFGGAESVLGQTLDVDGAPHEIIGVMPQDFRFLQQQADVLTPARPSRDFAFVPSVGENGIARLADGVALAEATADVERMIPILFDTFPIVPGMTRASLDALQFGPNLRSLKSELVGDLDEVLWVLMGTIGLLLLIACANVANLQLVRTEMRGQELAIRTALGAGWSKLARSLLAESALLGLAGGALGLALAWVSLPVLLAIAGGNLPSVLAVTIDPTVLAFTLAISLASGIVFGSVPVVKYAGPRVAGKLAGTGRAYGVSRERHRARSALVVTQVALALVLLIASGLMIRTFESLRDVDPGFARPDDVMTVGISMPQAAVPEFERVVRMQRDIEAGLSDIAGVESVGFASRVPLAGMGPSGPFSFEDKPDEQSVEVEFRYTSPGFLRTLGTPLVAGRHLGWADYDASRQVAVISENLARREWGSPDAALGKRMRRSEQNPWLEIVGVVGDVHHHGLSEAAPVTVYLSSSEGLARFASRSVSFFIRGDRVGTAGFVDAVQQAIWSVDGSLPLGTVRTLGDVYASSVARTSLTLVMLAITAAMALLLGLVGIYGVISYMLTRRTREIGVRMALGAQTAALKRLLVGQVLVLVAVGVALGLGGAAALTRLMESLLFGVTSLDPPTYIGAAALLVVTAALAGYLPARRVTRVDPMQALREE